MTAMKSRVAGRLLRGLLVMGAAFSVLAMGAHAAPEGGGDCLVRDEQARLRMEQGENAARIGNAFCAMYDLDFAKAEEELAKFSAQRPEDPMGPAARAAGTLFSVLEQHQILRTQFFVSDERFTKRKEIVPDEKTRQKFDADLSQAEQLAMRIQAERRGDANALFALTLVYGLRADYAALVEHKDVQALHFSNKGNEWARKLLEISPESYDAYVATGVQKYLVGLKPAPVRWMLRIGGIKGDRDEGLQELQLAADKGYYLAPFARILLAVAYLRKKDRGKSVEILTGLNRQFPHNPLFAEEVARLKQEMGAAASSAVVGGGGSGGTQGGGTAATGTSMSER